MGGEILPARVADYDPDWLDERCLAGHLAWMRLRSRSAAGSDRRAAPVRTTPIAILPRRHSGSWTSLSPQSRRRLPSPRAQVVADWIRQNGASFFHDLMEGCGLLRSQLEEAVAELVALGLVTSDSFGGLRALLVPSRDGARTARRRRRTHAFGMEDAGRWSLVRRHRRRNRRRCDRACRAHAATPLWRRVLAAHRAGGGVVAAMAGAVARLSQAREPRRNPRRTFRRWILRRAVCVARRDRHAARNSTATAMPIPGLPYRASDPLNLAGILTPGPKIASLAGNRVLYRDGIPVAALAAGEVTFFNELDPATEWQARQLLLRAPVWPPAVAPEVSAITQKELVPTK